MLEEHQSIKILIDSNSLIIKTIITFTYNHYFVFVDYKMKVYELCYR